MLFLFLYVCLYKWQYCSAKYIINDIVNNLVKKGLKQTNIVIKCIVSAEKKENCAFSCYSYFKYAFFLFPVAAARPLPVTFHRGNI